MPAADLARLTLATVTAGVAGVALSLLAPRPLAAVAAFAVGGLIADCLFGDGGDDRDARDDD